MFEKLFKLPAVIARHKSAPYTEERKRYLLHCLKQGYAHTTLLVIADELLWVAYKLSIYPTLKLSFEQIKAAAKDWKDREHLCGHTLNKKWTSYRFIRIAKLWLRFLGCLDEVQKPIPFASLLTDFCRWQEQERGLSPTTICSWRCYLRQFLCWYFQKRQPFAAVKLVDVDEFFLTCAKRGCCRVTINNIAAALRAFFRYARAKEWCLTLVAEEIKGPRIYAQEGLPSGPPWSEVGRLLASTETNLPRDIRNRAILMLFAIYGFRATEVANLRLDDIDWEHDQIVMHRVKGRGSQLYPLLPTVGNAILKYLQKVRPQSLCREVFLTLAVPFRPISRGGLYSLTSRQMQNNGIYSPRKGPHSLRHACAARLVSQGFSLKEIGDHLGHRSSSATQIYAKVDLGGMREVANFDLGELI